jgi:hypothetical protein
MLARGGVANGSSGKGVEWQGTETGTGTISAVDGAIGVEQCRSMKESDELQRTRSV